MFDKYIEKFKSLSEVKKRYNSLSKTWKIFVWFFPLMIISTIMNTIPNVDPCDCYQSFNKEKIMGFSNMSTKGKEFYNDCVKVCDNSRKANNGCLEKMGIE